MSLIQKLISSRELYMPFPLRLSPYNEPAWLLTVAWVKDFGLVSERAFGYFRMLDYHWLSAWAFPDADLQRLELVNNWMTLFYFFDKNWDDAPPEMVKAGQKLLLYVLKGEGPLPADAGKLELALHDVRNRMLKFCSPEWMAHFTRNVEAYFESCVWEAHNKHKNQIPDVASYIEMRRNTGAVQPSFELAGALGMVDIPPCVLDHPRIHELNRRANDVITLFNDLISLDKERKVGDVHNMVFIIEQLEKCSLEEAMARTVKMHNDEVRGFELLARESEETSIRAADRGEPPEGWERSYNPGALSYIDVLRCWMRSNMEWSLMSERYRTSED